MENQLIDQVAKGLTWQKAWSIRLRLMDSKNRQPIPPAGWRPCTPELLKSGVNCGAAPRWADGPIGQHWHPPVRTSSQAGRAQ
jgi:hypothetical protein